MSKQDKALQDAADRKDVKAAAAAIAAGADVNARDKHGRAPLHLAIVRRSKTLVKKLLEAGADPRLPDGKGQIPLTLLTQHLRDVKLAALLVDRGAQVDEPDQQQYSGRTPLHYAVKYAKLDLAQWLLDHGADLEAKDVDHGETPLLMLCRSESGVMSKTELANARWLMERGADLHATGEGGQTILHLAGASADAVFLRELLERGVKPTVSDYGTTPLHHRVTTNDRERVVWELLIRAGNPVNGGPRPLLHEAQSYWNHVAVQFLLEHGADPDATDEEGKTALQCARELKQDKIIGILERWQAGTSRAGPETCPECGGRLELIKADAAVPADQVLCKACGGMFDTQTMERVPVAGLRTEGRSFLFTGKLSSMTRAEAKARVGKLGGVAKGSVARDLDYLVIGDEGSPLFGAGKKGSKMIAAEKLIAAGAELKIISETDFLKLRRQ